MLTLLVFLATIALTVDLYIKTPKGYFPQDDTGLIFGGTRASPDISFEAMKDLQQRATRIVLSDPAVAAVGSSVGASTSNASVNNGRLFISLKPLAERGGVSSQAVINRLRPKLLDVGGMRVFMFPAQDVRVGGRQSSSSYQFTLWTPNLDELLRYVPIVVNKVRTLPAARRRHHRPRAGRSAGQRRDRPAGGRALRRAHPGHRQCAQQCVFAAADFDHLLGAQPVSRHPRGRPAVPARSRPTSTRVYVAGTGGTQVPLSSVARIEKGLAPLVINHQGQFPAVTITFNVAPDVTLEAAIAAIRAGGGGAASARTRCAPNSPATRGQFARSANAQPLVILAALLAVYIVLGVLYESLAHPLTIISTLPSAGLGALLALQVFDAELTVIAFIGIILLIGIVKKNGIMLVDFALDAERERGLSAGAGDLRGLPASASARS